MPRSDAAIPGGCPPALTAALARAGDRLGLFAGRLQWHGSVSSTNDLALALAAAGEPEGAVVVAEAQESGRGRLGRTWHSPPGSGLYVSVLLRPSQTVAALLTLAAGVALADGLAAATGLRPALKWPNDIWVGLRKLGGILAEGSLPAVGPSYVVLGFGLNLTRAALPPEVAARATSLEEELGRSVDRDDVLVECLAALAIRYAELGRHPAGVLEAWREAAQPLLGRRVEWDAGDDVRNGVATGVDAQGALQIETGNGVLTVRAGEVRWI